MSRQSSWALCREKVFRVATGWHNGSHQCTRLERGACSSAYDNRACPSVIGISTRDQGRAGAVDEGLSRQKTYVTTDRPQSLGRDIKFSIATRVVQLCVATYILFCDRARGWCCDSVSCCEPPAELAGVRTTSAPRAIECGLAGATKEFRRYREFSIAIDFVVLIVMTGKSLSR